MNICECMRVQLSASSGECKVSVSTYGCECR